MKGISEGCIKKVLSGSFIVLAVISLSLGLTSCATGNYLRTEGATTSEVTGTFTLMLYGCRYHGDMANVAILAREDTQRPFEIFAPEYDFTIRRNIPGKEALNSAERFLGCSKSPSQISLRKILDSTGKTVGYELRPFYSRLSAPSDVIDTSYISNGKVTVRIKLSGEMERQLLQ